MSSSKQALSRRGFGKLALASLALPAMGVPGTTAGQAGRPAPATDRTPQQWFAEWKEDAVKALIGPLDLRRFRDPMYILLKPIAWQDLSAGGELPDVAVPAGFVTDFASVPRPFWSLFRPDGNYAYAAVLHDYLYWEQGVARSTADAIFRSAMNDLKVKDREAGLLYAAVDQFGQASWNHNRKLRRDGERRVLTKFPNDPATTWQQWKVMPGVFER